MTGADADDERVERGEVYGWRHAALAMAAIGVGVAAGMLAGALAAEAFDAVAGLRQPRAFAAGEPETLNTARIALFLAAFQIASLLVCWAAIVALRRPGVALAPLTNTTWGWTAIAYSASALAGIAALYGAFVHFYDSQALARDVGPFDDMIETDAWPLLAIVAIGGAPFVEELTFRGLGYGVLAGSPVGPRAAAVVTSAVWATLHASYSLYGLTAIFFVGLYLAWLRERSGSLVPPMVCHAVYNALIFAALAVAPDGLFQV